MRVISRQELKEKMQRAESFILVDVLSHESFENFHLPGALNVPLTGNFEECIQRAVPDKNQEVVVYCKNLECTASPEAAKKMDQLGYRQVYDYEGGKEDWKAAGLPISSIEEQQMGKINM